MKYRIVLKKEVRKTTALIQYMERLPIIMKPISYKDYKRPGVVSLTVKYNEHDFDVVMAAKTIMTILRGIPAWRKAYGRPTMPPPIITETILKAASQTVSNYLSPSFF